MEKIREELQNGHSRYPVRHDKDTELFFMEEQEKEIARYIKGFL